MVGGEGHAKVLEMGARITEWFPESITVWIHGQQRVGSSNHTTMTVKELKLTAHSTFLGPISIGTLRPFGIVTDTHLDLALLLQHGFLLIASILGRQRICKGKVLRSLQRRFGVQGQ